MSRARPSGFRETQPLLLPKIRTSYSRVTPESAEDGDTSETGWIDEDGYEIDTDEDEYGGSVAEVAARWLKRSGAIECSSSTFHVGCWYSTEYSVLDYRTGEEEQRDFHLVGFTPEQEEAIHGLLDL